MRKSALLPGSAWRECLGPRIALLTIAMVLAITARAGSTTIFDDDWKPPTPAPPLTVVLPTSQSAVPTTPQPARVTQPQTSVPTTSVPPVMVNRSPIPPLADQTKSRKLFRELFAKELANHAISDRRSFAQKLLAEAEKSGSVPSDQFVLFIGAADAGREASDTAICFQAVDGLAGTFDVDAVRFKVYYASKISLKSDSPAATMQNCRSALALVDDLIAGSDYTTASRLLAQLRAPTAVDASLGQQVQARSKDVEVLRGALDHIAGDVAKPKSSPNDAAANLVVGKYLCFIKGDWGDGLPMLAKGSDDKLKQLASQDLSGKTHADVLASIADDWWEVAEALSDPSRLVVRQHAASIYTRAIGELTGLRHDLLERRIQAATGSTASSHVVNLLALTAPESDAVSGEWRRDRLGLTSDNDATARLRIPYAPPEEYDFHIQFTRNDGDDQVSQILTHSGRNFIWGNGASHNAIHAFSMVNGRNGASNKTKVAVLAEEKPKGRMHDSVVQIRKNYVAAYVDGRLVSRHETNFSDMSIYSGTAIGGGALGLATWNTPTTFSLVEVTEVTGTGHVLPHQK
jgi:hypothetical protein